MLLLLLVYSYGVSAQWGGFRTTKQTLSVNVTEEIVMQPGATVEKTVSIPDGFLNHADFEERGIFRNRLMWRIGIELKGDGNPENQIRVVLQHGRTSESYRLPYTRYLDRGKGLVTCSLPARIVDLCPLEPINERSELHITLVSTSQKPVTALVTPQLVSEGQGWHQEASQAGDGCDDWEAEG